METYLANFTKNKNKNSRRGRNPRPFVLDANAGKVNLKNVLDRNKIKKIIKKITFHNLSPWRIRSATEYSGEPTKFTFGLGLKNGVEWIQGNFQT
jgi:hypothetical protein